jgi:hypothetical protein
VHYRRLAAGIVRHHVWPTHRHEGSVYATAGGLLNLPHRLGHTLGHRRQVGHDAPVHALRRDYTRTNDANVIAIRHAHQRGYLGGADVYRAYLSSHW